MTQFFDDFESEFKISPYWTWYSTVSKDVFSREEIKEDKKMFIVECEIPGVKKEDINIEFDTEKNYLIIDAKRKFENEIIKTFFYKFEIDSKKYNINNYFLNLENGMLEISFPIIEKEKIETIKKLIFKEYAFNKERK
jgi:HSP20 family molecular chaperone IbpA